MTVTFGTKNSFFQMFNMSKEEDSEMRTEMSSTISSYFNIGLLLDGVEIETMYDKVESTESRQLQRGRLAIQLKQV